MRFVNEDLGVPNWDKQKTFGQPLEPLTKDYLCRGSQPDLTGFSRAFDLNVFKRSFGIQNLN